MKFGSKDAARLREAAHELITEHHLPGISVGIVSGDDLVFSEGFGYADIEASAPMTPAHRQRIASISKTMTGMCAMALVDEGRLSLDARVAELLPEIEFKGHGNSLTVWHLLTHTGGIGEVPNAEDLADPFRFLFCEERSMGSPAEWYASGMTLEVAPGTKYAYANHAYVLLGEVVARIEGKPIANVLEERIFGPLEMKDTDLLDEPHADLATGYHRAPGEDEREMLKRVGREVPEETAVDGHNIRGNFLYTWGNGAQGAVQSTIPDMARYATALLRQGGGIVRPETFDRMIADQWRPDPRLPGWGLAFGVRAFRGRRRFGHGGSFFGGWNSQLTVFPDDDLAVLIHVNMVWDRFDTVTVPRFLQAVLGEPAFEAPQVTIDPGVLLTAPGVYEASTPGPLTNFRVMGNCGRVQISEREGGLVLHSRRGPWKAGVPMLPADPAEPDLFALLTAAPMPDVMAVLRDDTGAVTGLRFPQIVDMHRAEGVAPWA
jgi:CubicO group peptidase (beta-lactamase class C family)